MEKNSRKNKVKHKSVGIFKREIDKEIALFEKRTGRKPSKEEKDKITKRVLNSKMRRFIAGVGAMLVVGYTGYKLGEGSGVIEGVTKDENQVTVNTTELGEDNSLNIQGQDSREIFVNGLKVDIGSIEQVAIENSEKLAEEQIRNEKIQDIKNQISSFQTKEDVLEYMKNLYKTEYLGETGELLSDFGITFMRDGTIKTIDNETNSIIEQVYNKENVKTDNMWYRATQDSEVLLNLSDSLTKLEELREAYNRQDGKKYLETYVEPGVVDTLIKYYDAKQEKTQNTGMEIGE